MLLPNKPIMSAAPPIARHRSPGFSPPQLVVLFAAFLLLISIPIWTHPLPPLSDYVNHLARMHVIATVKQNQQLARFYEIDWQVIPNLIMDFIVPLLAKAMNIYVAGQVYMVGMFALIISGIMVLNRALVGRWTAFPLLAFPLLYNYDFLVGLMNYIFGIGVSVWALAGWVALRERAWPLRYALSTASVVVLFFCHLSALGIYGIGILSFELLRLWQHRLQLLPWRLPEFVAGGLPFLAAAPPIWASPTIQLLSWTWWDQRGKTDGLMYVFSDYSDITAWVLIIVLAASIAWAIRHRVLRLHPFVWTLLVVGGVVYMALPRIMFDTYMTDQRVPIGVAYMFFACGDLELRRRMVRRAFMVVCIFLIGGRVLEIDLNWSLLSDSIAEFKTSVRRIAPGSRVFVAYADRALGEDVRDLGLVHAASIATIDRSALVTTNFTVAGKQVMHAQPQYLDYVDRRDGTPPSTAQLVVAADHPTATTPTFWKNWTKFDYLYVLFTEDNAPNPDPRRLKLIADGDRFQLYRIVKPTTQASLEPATVYDGR
jgi:hypothetical protein